MTSFPAEPKTLKLQGYVDDPRNTDNAWMETVAVNFHDESGDKVGKFDLKVSGVTFPQHMKRCISGVNYVNITWRCTFEFSISSVSNLPYALFPVCFAGG